MANKLFIICPFSQMEQYLQKKYGSEIYFITVPASIVEWNEKEYTFQICDFIERKSIGQLYIVNDTDCRFISGIVNNQKVYGLTSEKTLEDIFINHYFSDFKDKLVPLRKLKLAELSIKFQAQQILKIEAIGRWILEGNVELKGLITNKAENLYSEININQLKNV